jgi:hypothetical protein
MAVINEPLELATGKLAQNFEVIPGKCKLNYSQK